MSDTTYASSMGRLKAMTTIFLGKEAIAGLASARDIAEVARMLDGTPYSQDLTKAMETFKDEAALEVAINHHFVTATRFAYEAAPFAGRGIVAAYLKWWDIENIVAILASKAYGRLITESDVSIVSDRQSPAGVTAGVLSMEEIRNLLAQPTVDGVVQQLAKYGYGITLMEHLEGLLKTLDLIPVSRALEKEYYANLLAQSRFFQGDEWVVRQFIADEIDIRNILTLLKGKDSGVTSENLIPLFIDGGAIPIRHLADLAGMKTVDEVVGAIDPGFGLTEVLPRYREENSLVPFDIALRRYHANRSLDRMRSYPLSLAGIFHFLLLAKTEREDLRRIIYGKVYQIPVEKLSKELLMVAV